MKPVVLVIAGPNGSGKRTITVHTVPIEKIIARYSRSVANLPAAITIAHRVYVCDNSVDDVEARLCARTEEGSLRKIYCALPPWVASVVEPLPHDPQFVDLRAA